jgi:hypothetical protein
MFTSTLVHDIFPVIEITAQCFMFQDLCGGAGGGGGMWLTVLQLSGINRDLIHSYKQVMGAVASAMDDFTSYFFAFLLTHILILWT